MKNRTGESAETPSIITRRSWVENYGERKLRLAHLPTGVRTGPSSERRFNEKTIPPAPAHPAHVQNAEANQLKRRLSCSTQLDVEVE